jgi:hypothetical protein
MIDGALTKEDQPKLRAFLVKSCFIVSHTDTDSMTLQEHVGKPKLDAHVMVSIRKIRNAQQYFPAPLQ